MEGSPLSPYFRQRSLNKRDTAEANYAKDPLDADNLTIWGRALLQLSRYENGQESKKMIEDAILKVEEALVLYPLKHDSLFLLGKCFCALISHYPTEAKGYLQKALACFQKASQEEPENLVYFSSVKQLTKELEMNQDVRHTIANMGKGILTFSLDGTFSLAGAFPGAASSEAKDPEMDKERRSNVEDKNIHSYAEKDKDKDTHTNEEMGMDIDTNAEKDKGMLTNASDQQSIDAASSKMKSSKESSDRSLDQGTSFEEKNDTSIGGEQFQQQEVIENSASVAQGRARRETKLPVRFRD